MSRFARALLAIVLVALGVRVAYVALAKGETCEIRVGDAVVGSHPSECPVGDQLWYNAAANTLAAGDGFVEPLWGVERPGEAPPPAADHPPLTVVVLAPVSWLADRPPLGWLAGDDEVGAHVREHRYAMAALGAVLVALVGLLGRRVGGDAVGLVAAGIAAVSPNVWVNDGLIMSETVTGVAVVTTLLAALHATERRTPRAIAVTGALAGLATLARAELALLVAAVVVPLAWPGPGRARRLGAGIAAWALVVAPWVAYNLSRFEEPTFVSTNDGLALAASSCDPVWYGPGTGLTSYEVEAGCIDEPPPPGDQSEVSRAYRERALRYVREHLGRAPAVVAARVGRTWSLFRPLDMVAYNEGEGRERWVTRLGLVAYYPTLVAAVAGAVLLWRRRRRFVLWVLCTPALVVTVGSALTYGQTRFRAAAEPSLAVLAAVAVVAAAGALRRGRVAQVPPTGTASAAGSPA
ncbi:MAG: hypothetical protein KatS3mg009_2032 [Acidimicrobiia bacterium]|nr:MAG: hypothetical protein KatS3mg009_2032 [Acidimicrobiia bacterium]